ncbi:TPR repeats containing protein [Vibrio tubiashii]|nr:TPR repeats containing protein [Vibrio tubiashii]
MDKSQRLLEIEIDQLKNKVESEPEKTWAIAEQCAARSAQILYPEGEIQCLIIMSRCAWCVMDYRKGLKFIKEAHGKLNALDTDDLLPEILHIYALHYWGQARYYSAQQYWINALEQSALVDEIEIQLEALIGLGNVWRMTHEYNLAKTTHELAVIVANNARVNLLEGKARILLAWDHYLLNNYVEMLSVLDGAAEALKEHSDNTWQAEIWDFRGLALLGLERVEDAEEATRKAHEIAMKHDLVWMKAHSYISRARVELLRKRPDKAAELLVQAEQSAISFDNGELLSQICFQQSRVAEESGDFETALEAFKKYRKHSTDMLREQTARVSNDKARASKRQLEQRARKLINRIRGQHEFDPEKQLSQMVSETYWWEQLVLFKTELKRSNHAVIVIQHNDPNYLDVCTELAHSLCNKQDMLARLSRERLGILLADRGEEALNVFHVLAKMIEIYPWHRKGLDDSLPKVSFQDILTFPFTLEQLEDSQLQDEQHGSLTQ